MPASFDTNGHLYPYQPIKMELDELGKAFGFTTERKLLYEELSKFVNTLILDFGMPIELWINGSFATLKQKPNDIDIVIFIDDKLLKLWENELTELRSNVNKLDIYFVRVYPEFHKKAFISSFDKTEWLHLFSKDKKGKPKGFAQIIIDGSK